MNVFRVVNLQTTNDEMGWGQIPKIIYFNASVESRVVMSCDLHGNQLATLEMISHGKGIGVEDSMKMAIQNLLNHNYEQHLYLHFPNCNCDRSKKKMVFDFSGLPEEWRTLFEEIFKDAKWNPEMKMITAPQKTISNKL